MAKMSITIGRFGAMTGLWLASLAAPDAVCAAELRDSTPVPVRLIGVINSETTPNGQPLEFLVTRDVVGSNGEILIERGTPVAGVVTTSRRAHWGWTDRKPKLTFMFSLTTASDGQVIRLRASAAGRKGDSVAVDRYHRHHELRWASGAEIFEAYVDGTYEI